MAFAMSLPRTKRIKYLEPDGKEVYQEEDRWALVRAVHSQEPEAARQEDGEEKSEQPTPSSVSKLPQEAIEKLQMARGEMSMMLDLIDMLETQQFVGVASVPPQSSTLQQLARQKDLRLQTRASQLKDAAQRLRRGSEGLRAHLRVESMYFDNVAELATDWHVRPSPEFASTPGAAPYYVDLRLTGSEAQPDALQRIDLGKDIAGSLLVRGSEGRAASEMHDIQGTLREAQEKLLWKGITAKLYQEAQVTAASNHQAAAQSFANEVVIAAQQAPPSDSSGLRSTLLKLYLAGLQEKQKTGKSPELLKPVNAWVRHCWHMGVINASLSRQAKELTATGHQVAIETVPVPGPCRSVLRIAWAGKEVHVVVQADTTEVRGCGDGAGAGSRWASAGVLTGIGKQEIDTLLARLLVDT